MYARVTTIDSAPEGVEDGIASFVRDTVPQVRDVDGNLGALLLVDRGRGRSMAVTYWSTLAHLQASEEAATRLRGEAMESMRGSVTDIERYELVLQERTAPPAPGTFVRVIRGAVDPGKLDELAAGIRDQALPTLREQPGFRALLLGVDAVSGRSLISSVWETAADREASLSSLRELRDGMFAELGVQGVAIDNYESAVADVAATALK